MSDKNKKPKNKQAKAKSTPPMSNKAQDIAATAAKPAVDTDALDDAPMLGTAPVALGTLSASDSDTNLADAKQPRAEGSAPKKSMSKKNKSQAKPDNTADDDTPESKSTADKPEGKHTADDSTPSANPTQPAVLTAEPPAEKPDPFRLPRSAFVGLRKSGGLNFTTREVVFYPDGRVAYDARGVPQKEYTRLRRVMNDGQIVSLRKLLDQTNFWMTEGGGEQNPDAFAYEIAASLNHRSHEIEVFDGSLPENIKPLLERLSKFLPE